MTTIALRNKAGQKVNVPAEAFAQSAYEHDVSIDDFTLSLNNFSDASISSREQIVAWREECVELFFKKMEAAGKLKMSPVEFFGGSDYAEEIAQFDADDSEEGEGSTLCPGYGCDYMSDREYADESGDGDDDDDGTSYGNGAATMDD